MSSSQRRPARRGVVGVVVRNERLLVIRRSAHVVAPGQICFPGGGIEAHEDESAALVREFHEELGVTISPLRRLWHSVTPWNVELAWWQVALNELAPIVPNPAEVAEVTWHTPAEMARLTDLLESNHHFLQALAAGKFAFEA